MFARKLKALGYHHPESFSLSDETEVRNMIVWLEDRKICLYKIEDRDPLRNISSPAWVGALKKYLSDLACPIQNLSQKGAVMNWLLSHAIRLEYMDNEAEINLKHEEREKRKTGGTSDETESVLNDLEGDDPHLKAGISSLVHLLNLPHHPDHMIMLQAVSRLVENKLSESAIAFAKSEAEQKKPRLKEVDFLPLNKTNLGFETSDSAVNEAAKIIRLLHIHELRELQTFINESIVTVQNITADPRTDQSLGRVGR